MNKKSLIATAAVAALAGLGVAGWSLWSHRVPDEVRIGVGQPLSGPLAPLGQDMLHGVELAVEEINADGGVRIDGKRVKLKIVSSDDKSDPEAGKLAAKQLVEADVLVAVAHLNSGVSIPAAPFYADAGIPQLAISTKPQYTQLGLPTTLRLVANDDMQSKAIAGFALRLPGAERIAVVDDGTPYGKGLCDEAARIIATKRAPALRRSLENKGTEFAQLVAELRQAKVDLIVTSQADFQVVALIEQLVAAGMTDMRILGGDTIKTSSLLGSSGKIAGVYSTSPVAEPREFLGGAAFTARYSARFKQAPVYGSHYSYDAVHLVAHALQRNGSVDKARLLATLKSFDGNAPVTSTMRFNPAGDQLYGSVGIYQLRSGRWEAETRSDNW